MAYNSFYAHKKCLLICGIVAIANMQYGFDSSGVGGLQAMPGFLMVFGYKNPANELGYGINVSFLAAPVFFIPNAIFGSNWANIHLTIV
jgi:hypothetical protein